MGWLEGVVSLDGTLDKNERKKRMLFLLFMSVSSVFFLVYIGLFVHVSYGTAVRAVAMGALFIEIVVTMYVILHVCCKRPLVERLILWIGITMSLTVFCTDLTARTVSQSRWPALVLVVDFFLVMQVNDRIVSILVVTTICYLVVMAFEDVFRFGIFDLPGLIPQEGALGRKEHLRMMTDCSTPPCAVNHVSKGYQYLVPWVGKPLVRVP